MTLIPAMKQRLASPSDVVDLARIKELNGIKVSGNTRHHRRGDHACRGRRRRGAKKALPAWPISPRRSAIRMSAIAARSAARSPTTIPAADYPAALLALDATDPHQQARDRGGRFLHRPVRRRRWRMARSSPPSSFPAPAKAGYENSRTRPRAMRWPACSSPRRQRRRARRGDRRGESGVFRAGDRSGAEGELVAGGARQRQVSADGLMSDIHGSPEYRANLVKVMAKRAVPPPANG